MSTIKKAFNKLFENWVLCVATGLSTLTAIANTNTFGSENNLVANFMIFAISYSGLYMIQQAKASDDLLKLFYYSVAAVIALVSCLGSANYLMSMQNSDFQRLIAAERAVKNADIQVITAKVMLADCEKNHYKDCIKLNSAIVLAKESKYNAVFEKYNSMNLAQNKSEIAAFNAKTFGLDTKQFMFAKWLTVSFLFGLVEYLLWIGSSSKPLGKRDTAEHDGLKKTVKTIINLSDLTEIQAQVLAAYDAYDAKEQILRNGLPSPMSQFTVAAFGAGKQGSTHKNNAINALYQLGFITEETYKKQQTSEV